MRNLSLATLALLGLAACDRSEPPAANQAAPDANLAAPAPAPIPAEPLANEAAPPANAGQPVAGTGLPVAYQGTFDQNAAACDDPSSVYRLEVSANELRFHESLGEVKAVTPDGENAVRVAADYSGEGMSWSNIQRFALSDGGERLTVTGEGAPFVRTRC